MLRDKTVIVTGVGTGLGRECVESALRYGANVVIAARTQANLDAVAGDLDPDGKRVVAQATDITDAESCESLVALALDRFGTVDALVQVAAFDNAWGGLHDLRFDNWRKAYETNVIGALTVLRPVTTAMKGSGGGSIVLIGSQSMFKPPRGLAQAGYAASKGALLSAMYYLADELGPDNIRCNMVVPSYMLGPPVQMLIDFRSKQEGKSEDEVIDDITGEFPLRRMAEDGEVANVATFFASDLASAVTGQYLLVNAGELLR